MIDRIDERLELAKRIAVEAGDLASGMRSNRGDLVGNVKSHQDFVTAADLAAERLIRDRISEHFSDDSVLGEEQGTSGDGKALWVVDPIDGTTNFMHGLADWCVSIAFCYDGVIVCGAIYVPDSATLAWASLGNGAFMNGERMAVSSCVDPKRALVLLGRSGRTSNADYLSLIKSVFEQGMEYRRNGSAAVSLLTVACGRVEGFYESHLNAWDVFAGILLIQEAGGKVDCPSITEFITNGGYLMASNTCLHDDMSVISRAHDADIALAAE
ncbi:inositol monophosphatase family protein [Granulosicoccus antarcticus]|uniref:Inositol-1-monophosphatase n=1 Tax=Granulosicoccus antarcticus IMCC3135 TaxID=1192854 RepID=A0A2Z2NUI9_9GAMM|nr:inositol monophosphatase family protein [Granulosicoccus antarcticus]ASJ73398.1 Fructose-1,6-bisphosphatase/inositol-1-monophosphatase [Granulosicoccus antarcticus IMCC3135]